MESKSPEDVLANLEQVCRVLTEGGQDLLSWEWDGRFSAALAVAKDPQHHEVLALLASHFTFPWDTSNIDQAPERVVALGDSWGGLWPGQRIFTRDPEEDPLLYAVWWPWGGGGTFSLRITCDAHTAASAALNPLSVLRSSFGV